MKGPDRPSPFIGPSSFYGYVVHKITCMDPTFNQTGYPPPCTTPANAGQQDLLIYFNTNSNAQTVFCQTGVGQGGCPTPAAGDPYNGMVLVNETVRFTDHDNTAGGPAGTPCAGTAGIEPNCLGTMIDLPMSFGAQCSNGHCGILTSYNATFPGIIKEVKRANIEIGQVSVQDAGQDGALAGAGCPPTCAQNDASFAPFLVQGVFAP
jgi:hypothetical protein